MVGVITSAAGRVRSRRVRGARFERWPRPPVSRMPVTVASPGCSTTSESPSRISPRPSASTPPCSPRWASSPVTRTPGWSSGRTGPLGPTDREHPVTRGLHVGFRARDRAQVDAFWRAGGRRCGVPRRRRSGAAHAVRPDVLRRVPARPRRQQRRGGLRRFRGGCARRPRRPPVDPRPRPAGLPALLHDDRPARRAPPDLRRARPRAALRPGPPLLAHPRRAAAH